MGSPVPHLAGSLAAHPAAAGFAREVVRVHTRYANEVVGAFGVCPHFRDAAASFGRFCVILDVEPDVRTAIQETVAAASTVVHLVYPIVRMDPSHWERFGNSVGEALQKAVRERPVVASFHPDLGGDVNTAPRLVGVLRRAPDPFVQVVPTGLHQGGTVLAGTTPPTVDVAYANFKRLSKADLATIVERVASVRADRDASYAPWLKELAVA